MYAGDAWLCRRSWAGEQNAIVRSATLSLPPGRRGARKVTNAMHRLTKPQEMYTRGLAVAFAYFPVRILERLSARRRHST